MNGGFQQQNVLYSKLESHVAVHVTTQIPECVIVHHVAKMDLYSINKPALNICFDIEWKCHFAGAASQIGSSVQRRKFVLKFHPISKHSNIICH